MSEFKLLRPEEVIDRWCELSTLLNPAVDSSNGEVVTDDILRLVIGGRMFVFADEKFALTCEFIVYPQKTVMVAGFGAGQVTEIHRYIKTISEFAKRGGASAIQTYVRKPAMVRYYKRLLNIEPLYSVMEIVL